VKLVSEFRDRKLASGLAEEISRTVSREYRLMEVCGTHTVSIFRHGIRSLLPPEIRLLSGPGCPVCVTENSYLDAAVAVARKPGVIITTFADMLKVPGSSSSLEKERARGAKVLPVYSPADAVSAAVDNPGEEVVFLAVGFETTSPTVAAALSRVEKERIGNFSILCAHKLIPPAMEVLVQSKEARIDGFICPAHVSAIIGAVAYEKLCKEHRVPCVVTGFEPVDILQGILMLSRQLEKGEAKVEIQYSRVVTREGNSKARRLVEEFFEVTDARWRGLGSIPGSGLRLRMEHRSLDALARIEVEVEPEREPSGCICGSVLRGVKTPADCKLFKKVCRPENPVGACMVSSEGACSAFYKYGGY